MAELAWTRDKPTEPGTYVFRPQIASPGGIVEVQESIPGHLYEHHYGTECCLEHWWLGYWYGPLPRGRI